MLFTLTSTDIEFTSTRIELNGLEIAIIYFIFIRLSKVLTRSQSIRSRFDMSDQQSVSYPAYVTNTNTAGSTSSGPAGSNAGGGGGGAPPSSVVSITQSGAGSTGAAPTQSQVAVAAAAAGAAANTNNQRPSGQVAGVYLAQPQPVSSSHHQQQMALLNMPSQPQQTQMHMHQPPVSYQTGQPMQQSLQQPFIQGSGSPHSPSPMSVPHQSNSPHFSLGMGGAPNPTGSGMSGGPSQSPFYPDGAPQAQQAHHSHPHSHDHKEPKNPNEIKMSVRVLVRTHLSCCVFVARTQYSAPALTVFFLLCYASAATI